MLVLPHQLEFSPQPHEVLREAERVLADKEADLAKLSADLDERSVTADSQRIELVALKTQVEALKNSVTTREREAQEVTALFADLRDFTGLAERLSPRGVIPISRSSPAPYSRTCPSTRARHGFTWP